MSNLFNDPVRWSGAAVGTWLRFSCVALTLVVGTAYVASHTGGVEGRTAAGTAWMLAFYQVTFLYAMRRMYLKLQSGESSDRA